MGKPDSEALTVPSSPGEPSGARAAVTASVALHARSARSSGLDRWLVGRILAAVGDPPVRMRLWDQWASVPEGKTPVAELEVLDRAALYRLALNPDLQFGEAYSARRVEVHGSLVEFLEAVYRARYPDRRGRGMLKRALLRRGFASRNTRGRARENIHHHYDIGNDFYRLWLDRQMLYTCAYYPRPELSLEAAQVAKMDHVARKLWLRPGEQVVEAGCGWGALALHMARRYGVRVRAYNISREQLAFARDRARQDGLEDRVELVEGDYRDIRGQYDAFVSVGMLEHVGVAHYDELGSVMAACLRPQGRALIHSIGRDQPGTMNRWIAKRIFPGAHPPSLSEMTEIFEPWGFSVLDVENLRLHYARTLEDWLERYEAAADQVRTMFDPSFERAWRLYLAGSVAAFRAGTLQLFQVVCARAGLNQIPWSREHLYRG